MAVTTQIVTHLCLPETQHTDGILPANQTPKPTEYRTGIHAHTTLCRRSDRMLICGYWCIPPSITISGIKNIGKETNMLDERIAGLVPSEMEFLVIEPDEWETKVLPLLRVMPAHVIAEKTGLSRRQIIRLKQGKHRPHKETMEKIRLVLKNGN